MWEKFLSFVGLLVVGVLLFSVIIVVLAYPTKWLVNYLFSPALLLYIFGAAKLGIWQAVALDVITSILFKGQITTRGKK